MTTDLISAADFFGDNDASEYLDIGNGYVDRAFGFRVIGETSGA